MRRRAIVGASLVVAGLGWLAAHRGAPASPADAPTAARSVAGDGGSRPLEGPEGRPLVRPNGAPTGLSCADARRVVRQVRGQLAGEPPLVEPAALAEATADWLDPHGLWSIAPDAPVAGVLLERATELRDELESADPSRPCRGAAAAADALGPWIATLAAEFDASRDAANQPSLDDAFRAASDDAFDDGEAPRTAYLLAEELGRRVGLALRAYGDVLAPEAGVARARLFPVLDAAAWESVVLAAAVRAYVPLVDPHGAWAPVDEESSLYEAALDFDPERRLWDKVSRAALGVRAVDGARDAMRPGDLVVAIDGVPTAALSVEQVEQLALADEGARVRRLAILRAGERAPRELDVPVGAPEGVGLTSIDPLASRRVAYADGDVLVVALADVPDDLGDRLAATIAAASGEHAPDALVLDLRGNGGGSTDGARAALGLFLPGATLFPMRRRDGSLEVERAPEPPASDRWTGPLATLVDGDTASAAEMLAGALGAYHRALVVGARTYGKGCAQEYLDDDAHAGLLRLTTLVFALPDGAPVQKTGLAPSLPLLFESGREREADVARALAAWRGPDVRDRSRAVEVAWPPHHGRVGPCEDEGVCRALRALGAPRAPVARTTAR